MVRLRSLCSLLLLSCAMADRTVIMIYQETIPGQELFLRGGVGDLNRPGCSSPASTDICAIDIKHKYMGTTSDYEAYNYWRVNDVFLDWYGSESGQGAYSGIAAEGTPLKWTSNDPYNPSFNVLNVYGENYWMVDLEMDCADSEDGWFEIKAFIYGDGGGWEADTIQDATCTGDVGGSTILEGINHSGRCGYINVFTYGAGTCVIDSFNLINKISDFKK